MSAEIERFVADLRKDPGFNQEIEAKRGDVDAIVQIAASRGYKFTRADTDSYVATHQLNDTQLDQIAGGKDASWGYGMGWPFR